MDPQPPPKEGNSVEEKKEVLEKAACAGQTVCRVANIVSCFLLSATGTFGFIFANINPYVTSYLRNATHSDLGYTDTLWLEQAAAVTQCVSMPLFGMLSTKTPTRLFLLLGVMLNAAFLFGTWWTVKVSLWVTLVTYGIIGGFARAVLYPLSLSISANWAPNRKGLVTGIVLMGFGIGPLAWNPLSTWYVNPDNLQPDLHSGEDRYYTQNSVLDKVPTLFLWGGVIFTAIQLLCLAVTRDPPHQNTEKIIPVNTPESDFQPERNTSPGHSNTKYQNVEYGWKQVLRARVFWTIWFIIVVTGFGTSYIIPLFKAFGETFIADDHFLSVVATLSSVFNAMGRPFWGLLADRVGHRMILLLTQACLAILVATFSSCEETGKVAYLLWVCGMFLCICGYYTMLPVLVLSLFGTANFKVNMGFMGSSGVFEALIPTLTASSAKAAFGWHGLFFVSFGGIFTGLFLNLSLEWFTCGDTIPQDMLPKLSIKRKRSTPSLKFVLTELGPGQRL